MTDPAHTPQRRRASLGPRTRKPGRRRARDQLIVHYSPLVKYVAGRVAVGLPQNVDQADLVSYGLFGLIDAIDKFEPERGFKFETYAISRIKGNILDELRAIDWVPRSVRAKARQIENAYAKLEAEAPSHPDRGRGRRRARHDPRPAPDRAVEDLLRRRRGPRRVRRLGRPRRRRHAGRHRRHPTTRARATCSRSRRSARLLAEAINRLPEREKVVLTLYYYEGLTLAQIGEVIGVTESRVCQIHTKAILQLRSRMQAADREPV